MTQPCNESTRLQTEPSQSTPSSALRGPCLDEVRRDHGVPEDTVKFFCSGGEIPIRKNHEQETKYTLCEVQAHESTLQASIDWDIQGWTLK